MKLYRREFLMTAWGGAALARAQDSAPQAHPVELFASGADGCSHGALALAEEFVRELAEERRRQLAKAATAPELRAYQETVRKRLWSLLGGRPASTPLRPEAAGTLDEGAFRIEKLLFESRPRFFVAANLYAPAGAGPFPAAVFFPGDEPGGKAAPPYQILCRTLASNGCAALCLDGVSQRERVEHPGPRAGESRLGGPAAEREVSAVQALLTGRNFAFFGLWDGVRALDYLAQRGDMDASRLACAGHGYGALTALLVAALDPRIRAAAAVLPPLAGNASPALLSGRRASPAELLVPGLAEGFDGADLLIACADRPLRIAVQTPTSFSEGSAGSGEQFAGQAEAERAYRTFDAAGHFSAVPIAAPLGFAYESRRAVADWLGKWLELPGPVAELGDRPLREVRELDVSPRGRITYGRDAETVFTLLRRRAGRMLPREVPDDLAGRVRCVLALPERLPRNSSRLLSRTRRPAAVIEEFDLAAEGRACVQGWFVRAAGGESRPAPCLLYAADEPAAAALREGALAESLVVAGVHVAVINPRGRAAGSPAAASGLSAAAEAHACLAAGKPLLGLYVEDILRTADCLRTRSEAAAGSLWLAGRGVMGVAALFALALDDKIRGAVIEGALVSYHAAVRARLHRLSPALWLFDVLRHCDLPHLAAALVPRPLLVLDPVDPEGRAMSVRGAEAEYGLARQAYEGQGAEKAFRVQARFQELPSGELQARNYLDWIHRF